MLGQELSQGVEEVERLLDDRRLLDSSGDPAEVLEMVTWSFVTISIYLFIHALLTLVLSIVSCAVK